MNFNTQRPIYRQIADYCFARILSGDWRPGEKVASVRELALQMTVNTHTVLKAFEYLQNHQVIEPRRGMGYYLAEDAPKRVRATLREEFFETAMPEFFEQMRLLGIEIDDIVKAWHEKFARGNSA